MTDRIDAIAGAKETLERIKDERTRKALQQLLETAIELKLDPRLEPLGNQPASASDRAAIRCAGSTRRRGSRSTAP